MLDLLSSFVAELRTVGIPVSIGEHVDAARAIDTIDIIDRSLFRAALSSTLVKRHEYQPAFDVAFDVFFADRYAPDEQPGGEPGDGRTPAPDESPRRSPPAPTPRSAQELDDALFEAMAANDASAMRSAAGEAVDRYAGIERGRPVGGAYYLYRLLRRVDLDAMGERLQVTLLPEDPDRTDEQLARDEAGRRVRQLTEFMATAIREQLVEDRGAQALVASLRKPLPEDVDVMSANRDELLALEATLRPLSRKLAAKLARRRRRQHRGPVDLRHTVRRSLSTGGVPIDLRFKPPHPAKPDIVVIADLSGSVASFARFTLMLVHALSSEFSHVRSFAFIDGVDEVTRFFDECDDPAEAADRISAEAAMIAADGHSDYGRVLTLFHTRYAHQLTRRSTVLILGDARTNYHVAHADLLGDLRTRVKALYWLNPEPEAYWNSGDSVMQQYAPHCDAVLECRTLRQLEHFVGGLS